jgi:TolB-like protein/DNA-binding winged helix-turn-helix (wHTH) protein/Tfp pilus assembly protein PilF
MSLQSGFTLGDWIVYPLEGRLVGEEGEQRVQPKSMDVLLCLAECAGTVAQREHILRQVWGERAQSDEPLTRCIGELRRVLGDMREEPEYILTVPKRGYRLLKSVMPLVNDEVTIHESRRSGGVDALQKTESLRKSRLFTVRKIAIATVILIAASLAEVTIERLLVDSDVSLATNEPSSGEAATDPKQSIAVLPFVNFSSDEEQEYFSDGISEELLNVLAKTPGLRVAARTSSFQFKGENRDAIDIGQQLNVGLVLEGSVRKAGLQIRISALLIDASNGFHLWSETYDRELKNIFALQDEISTAIVGALTEHLGLQVQTPPVVIPAANTEAHDAYLRGRYLVVQRTQATIESAVREFEKAIELDHDYALAHAELAIATVLLKRDNYGGLTTTEVIVRAAPHAERAMALDPSLAEAHAATGQLLWSEGNFEEALTHLKQAIQLNPNYSIVYNWLGIRFAERLGRYAEGFAAFEMAQRLDPLSVPAIENYVVALIERGRLVEAEKELEKLAAIAPGHYAHFRGALTSQDGRWANAVLAQLDALRITPDSVPPRRDLTRYFATIGLDKEALAISAAPLPIVLSMLGRPADAVTTAEARLAEEPDLLTARRDLGLALAGAGDYVRARPILEDMWRRSAGQISRDGLFRAADAAALSAIYRAAEEDDEVAKLVAAIRGNVRRNREAGITAAGLTLFFVMFSVDYEEGLAAYLEGDREKGIALIAKAAEDGFFILPGEDYLQVLYDDPGFASIRVGQEARQARERERFLAIVCTDNPYATIWQPAEGTCEQSAAAGGN